MQKMSLCLSITAGWWLYENKIC